MARRETENNAYAKFCGDKQKTLWYVMVFSGVVNRPFIVRVLSQGKPMKHTVLLNRKYT